MSNTNAAAKTAAAPTLQKVEDKQVKALQVANPEKAAPDQRPEPKPLTLSERLKKVDELRKLTEKRAQLVEHLDNLNEFVVDPTGSASLRFQDANGHTFTIQNPTTVAEMVENVKARISNALTEIENQITF